VEDGEITRGARMNPGENRVSAESGDTVTSGLPVRAAFVHRPDPPADALIRTELNERLDQGLDRWATVVCAPAGFGKSVLVSQWSRNIRRRTCWMSIDPAIDNPRWFLTHFVAAVRNVFPDALELTSQMASAPLLPTEDVLITELSNELDELPDQLVVVLDDYHQARSAFVHHLVSELITHPSPMLRLVIISREKPPLPTGTLRAQGHLCEVLGSDLAFSVEEIDEFVAASPHHAISPEQAAALHASTEGWPTGVRLAIEALRLGGDEAMMGAGFLDEAAQEYLVAEVLDRVPAQVRRHLLLASHFSRFSAELCDAIAAVEGGRGSVVSSPFPISGEEFIDWIRQRNLFIVPLDETGDWYRFHHLFARLLDNWRAAAGPGLDVPEEELRRAAARVFLRNGMVEEAIDELRVIGADDELAAVAAEKGNELIELEQWTELERLVSRIPPDLLDNDPDLLMLQVWILGEVQSRHREMSAGLDRVERLLDESESEPRPTARWLRGQVLILRGAYEKLLSADFEGAVTDAEEARRLLADLPGRHLTFAFVLGVVGLAGAGRSDDAHRLAGSVIGDPRFADAPFDPLAWSLPYLGWLEGDLTAEELHATQLLSIGQRFGLESTITTAHYFLGSCAYERNQLADAEHHASIVFDNRFAAEAVGPAHAGMILASIELAQGRHDDADASAQAVVQYVLESRSEFLQPEVEAFMAEFDLRRGRPGRALRWARTADPLSFGHRYMWFDPIPARIEILLSSGEDAERGRELLADAIEVARRNHHRPLTIRLLGLHALDLDAQGDEAGALDVLEDAVNLSHEGGIVRKLADLGPRLAVLLRRLDVNGDVLTHVGTILAAIDPSSESAPGASAGLAADLALTSREADVLRLLDERLSNKEIARELMIAPATVKKHTVTLYEKLNVHGRREAVAKARALGYVGD